MGFPKAVIQFREKIKKEVNGKIGSVVMYGSVARGKAKKDSDIDIFILVKGKAYGKRNTQLRETISDIRNEIDLENESLITIVYYPVKNFLKRYKFDPFLRSVIKDGKILYDEGIFSNSKRNARAS